jgi:UDPglucose 6-dehydrogenase
MAKISVIGSGFVGESVGKGFMGLGHDVIFYDVVDKNLPNFTKDINSAINGSEISFICVPTPTLKGGPDLRGITEVMKNTGSALASQQNYHVVVIKSTVIPTTTENILIPILETHSAKKAGEFGVCMNPEFITEIAHTWASDGKYERQFLTEDRIVIGEYDKKSGDVLEELFKPLNRPLFRVSLQTAEMIKYASNCMLAAKISYWNEIFLICQKLGVNSQAVADIAGIDPRIGQYGTVHGKAFGGKCLPKDLKAFISFAKKYHKPILLEAVDEINEVMNKEYGIRE